MKIKLTKVKNLNQPLTFSDNYMTKCGRFTVEKKFGFGNTIWWLIIDSTQKLDSWISNCDTLREARENIALLIESK